jgi:hypothetical protein
MSSEAKFVTPLGSFHRAGGECVCADCGRPYRKHPYTEDRDWQGTPFLNRLCDGRVVKL